MSDTLPGLRLRVRTVYATLGCLALLLSAGSCGPELTDPSSVNISGHWLSTDQLGPVSEIALDLTQHADGTIEGNWSGMVSPPDPVCPPGLSAISTGPVNGRNSVLGVQLAVLGAGDFTGQIVSAASIRGSFKSCDITYSFTFTKTEPPL